MSAAYLAALTVRRSIYAITNKSSVSDAKLESIINHAVTHSPTAFNTQATRAVLVTGAANAKLWDLITESVIKGLEGESKERNKARMAAFAGGYGSVLFFEDQAVIEAISQKLPKYAKQFPEWSANGAGMLQSAIWTAFSAEGLGANLQHNAAYSDELARDILKAFDLPETWKSTAILPFGDPAVDGGQLKEKTFLPIEERVKVFN
ncbi:Nitroreductase-like protein [Roridomyces roridus]|uniref:Nitroreductase-like protein n=1 Tax=Roridomyces roridus TaxID=1738132 RepID=A0AAD7FE81_9AGAR|nr:Nitroreductase-like protein [Roridomyces roridus]